MSAAALVAYERTDSRYSLHHSHWGAAGLRLVDAVTPATPFGGSADRDTAPARKALAAVQAGRDVDALPPVDPAGTLVNPAPVATGVARESVPDHVDPGAVGAVYLVSTSLDVRAFLPVGVGIGGGAARTGLVALRAPPARDAERLRAWADGVRRALAVLVDCGSLDRGAATALFGGLLADRAGEREVLSGTGGHDAGGPRGGGH